MNAPSNTQSLEYRQKDIRWVANLKMYAARLIDEWDTFDLTANMTLILLMLYSGNYWYIERPITIICSAAIIHRPLRRSELFWFVTTAVMIAGNYHNWYSIDNHKYLITYWCIALYVANKTHEPAKTAALSAKYLIGLAFLFATIWKLTSSNYLTGAFFHYSLLIDERFASLASFVGQLSQIAFTQNSEALQNLLSFSSEAQSVQLQSTSKIMIIAYFLTWWTALIEGVVAISFLIPEKTRLAKWRDVPLLLFIMTTYSLAPVIGFGWVLIIMGASQSTLISKYNRLFYVVAFFTLQVYLMPWQKLISYYL